MAETPTRDSKVTLREVTAETVRTICSLKVSEKQNQFVAPNAISISQAHFAKEAWFRAIYADDTPVGFIMLHDDPEKPEYFLWRYMIAHEFQGRGFGAQAIRLVIEHVRTRPNAKRFLTSVVPGEGSPQGFYEGQGFKLTGDEEDGELVMAMELE